MKQFIDKLIERLEAIEEHCLDMHDWQGQSAIVEAKEIVNQLAEEHKDDIQTIDVSELLGESVNDGWIACSERLPEIGQKVLVTYADRYVGGCYGVCDGMYIYSLKMWDIADYEDTDDFKVLAWRELPKPYQPKGKPHD